MTLRKAVAICCALLSWSASAETFDPGTVHKEPVLEQRWYGWQTLASDVASTTVLLLGPQNVILREKDRPIFIAAGAAGLALGPAAIHLAQGNPRGAVRSVLGRLLLPVGGAVAGLLVGAIGCGQSRSEVNPCPMALGALGGLAGGATAIALDAAAWSWRDAPAPRPRAEAWVAPTVVAAGDRAGLGLVGQF